MDGVRMSDVPPTLHPVPKYLITYYCNIQLHNIIVMKVF